MQLTKNFVKAKNSARAATNGSCVDHNGQGDYQAVLDALVADGRVGDACWLLDQFGPTDAVLRLDEIDASAVVFAGTIEVRMGINVDSVVRAGRGIVAGGGIRAGESVIAGENIQSAPRSPAPACCARAATSAPNGASRRPTRWTAPATRAPNGMCARAAR